MATSPALTTIAMCGLAFSGKSRLPGALLPLSASPSRAQQHQRRTRAGRRRGLTVEQWEATSAIAMGRLGAALTAGQSAVVDDTHSHRFLRDRCRAVAERHEAGFTVLFIDTPLEHIERRRAANLTNPSRPHIADHVFAAHRDGFQFPKADEPGVVTIRSDADLDGWLERFGGLTQG